MTTRRTNPASLASWLAWAGFGLWFVTLGVVSSLPGQQFGPMPFNAADKLVHFLLFFSGAVPLTWAQLHRSGVPRRSAGAAAWFILAMIAASDEVHQLTTPGRSGADPGDWLADVLGATAGILFTLWVHGRFARPHPPAPGGDRPA